jgi:hypothetical protein
MTNDCNAGLTVLVVGSPCGSCAISAFGQALLRPIDVGFGWIIARRYLCERLRQERPSNHASRRDQEDPGRAMSLAAGLGLQGVLPGQGNCRQRMREMSATRPGREVYAPYAVRLMGEDFCRHGVAEIAKDIDTLAAIRSNRPSTSRALKRFSAHRFSRFRKSNVHRLRSGRQGGFSRCGSRRSASLTVATPSLCALLGVRPRSARCWRVSVPNRRRGRVDR